MAEHKKNRSRISLFQEVEHLWSTIALSLSVWITTISPLDANDAVLPHIKLAPTRLSQFSCRRQSRVDRISTAEAAVLLLEELHVAELLRASVLQGLKELNLAFILQGRGLNYVETKSTRFLNRLPKEVPTSYS
eukprot:GEMP01127419.1.p1 GENE.GEMP01127419.1~~GEMP01127419.1.p1  ORF type:complete len:134 (+),score=12.19 GEMP01127419.1:128-529(+)